MINFFNKLHSFVAAYLAILPKSACLSGFYPDFAGSCINLTIPEG